MHSPKLQRILLAALLAAGGVVVGANMSSTNIAKGEVTARPEPPTFQAGGVPILKDISATLRQMDGRLARLESVAQKMQAAAAARSLTRNDDSDATK
jgi:hypothetical protein